MLGTWLGESLQIPALASSAFQANVALPAPPTGAGQPVMVVPGFLTSDWASTRLRRSLAAAGYAAYGWGLGRNRGARADLLERMGRRLALIEARHNRPVALVGWSLGGVYARELAKIEPQKVALVLTLGSPFSGDLRRNNAWRLYEWVNDHPVDRPPLKLDLATKPPVLTIAAWSARDGIVAPAAARGLPHEADFVFEMPGKHLALARSARCIALIGALLAEHLRPAR